MVPLRTRVYIAIGIFVAGFLLAYNLQRNSYETKISRMETVHATAIAEAQEKARQIEAGWYAAMMEVHRNDEKRNEELAISDAGAADSHGRVREANRDRAARATEDTPAACRSVSATSALLLYSELLDRCTTRVLQYGREAELRRNAGLTCVEAYNAVYEGQ